jgi:hypothetical protein
MGLHHLAVSAGTLQMVVSFKWSWDTGLIVIEFESGYMSGRLGHIANKQKGSARICSIQLVALFSQVVQNLWYMLG